MRHIFVGIFAFVALIFLPQTVRADVNNFTIDKFNVDYVLNNDVPGGSLKTTESIELTYAGQNHGIFRSIPNTYNGFDTKLNIINVERDGKPEPYTTSTQNGNLVLKIGDPDKTITGTHNYEIFYTQERIVNFNDNQVEFFWDVNGTEWQQDFLEVNASVKVAGYNISQNTAKCFTGTQGSTEADCLIYEKDNEKIFSTNRILFSGENMSIAVDLNNVAFVQVGLKEKLYDNVLNIVGLLVGIFGSAGVIYVWLRFGKDHKGRGTIIPEYEVPKKLSPAEVGMLADYSVDSRDLTATLIDLAVRKYIRLHEELKKYVFIKSRNYSVELVKSDFSKLKEHEVKLLNGMFDSPKIGDKVELKKLDKRKMSKAVTSSKNKISKNLKKKYGYIDEKSTVLQTVFFVLGGVALFGAFFVFSFSIGFGVGLVLWAGTLFIFGGLMRRRTHAGVEIYEKIMGLKMYLHVADRERLRLTQGVDRPYEKPKKTVELFEKMLPYAVALGVEKSWAKQFDGILTERPDWITSDYPGAFTGAAFASSISNVSTSFGSSFQTSSSSGSGGVSGGGGGGGGGGGW